MKNVHSDIKSRVYGRICASAPHAVWTIGDFADFGRADAIRKALQRLVTVGDLRRIGPGLYDRPRLNPLTNKPSPPDYRGVIEAIARRDQIRVLVDGMTAANDLGLSDAVPGRVVIHSDARLKPIRLGNLTITFRPTSASKLIWAGRPGMRIVQALHWLKPKLDNPAETQRIRRRIQTLLEARQGNALRKDLKRGLPTLPMWMQDFLRDLVVSTRHTSHSVDRHPANTSRKAPAK